MVKQKWLVFIVIFQTILFGNTYLKSYKFNQDVQIDGNLDEIIWKQAPHYSDFLTFQPSIGNELSEKTIAYSAYDEENLYFAFKCLSDNPDKIQGTHTERDNIFSEDWVIVMLDSYNDRQSAYEFIVNPHGVQGDLIMKSNGDDASPDFIWQSAGIKTDKGYNVEMAIPLKSIRFEPGEIVEMGVYLGRHIPSKSEKGIYPAYNPDNGDFLQQMGTIEYENLNYERTYELLPSITRNYQLKNQNGKLSNDLNETNLGVTAKMGITPTLTLDATINPDFSQIEADAGRVDANVRSSIYYNEKRPFFMEGNEKFEVAGTGSASAIQKAVHTRTIIDPSAGLKLSGKIGKSNAISTIIASDESPRYNEEDVNQNAYFGILRYKRLLDKGSHIGGLYTSRFLGEGYNQVLGLDSRLKLSGKVTVEGNSFYSATKDRETGNLDQAYNVDLDWTYNDKYYYLSLSGHDISKNFGLQSGYMPRDGISALVMSTCRRFYLDNDIIQKFQPGMYNFVQYDKYDDQTEYLLKYNNNLNLTRNTYFHMYGKLSTESYSGKLYRRDGFGLYLRSQPWKKLGMVVEYHDSATPWYDEDDPQQADQSTISMQLEFEPLSSLKSSVVAVRSLIHQRSNNEQLVDYRIFRNRTTYQINKYLFIRATIEYNTYKEELLTDFLASFNYIPGTVVHIGYGALYEKTQYQDSEYIESNNFLEMQRGFFLKASYNWRI
ncbi:MAG: carbohydrate binding family 9 domain-containing protein [Candidatus Marinimicrobia bacterium]|nr:carbohydrate binding family 9 domain-containing protein [Candidatus Neomarinimicrobiota bacterium]